MVAFQAILVSFQTRHIASIGTHINALVRIGVWGGVGADWGLEGLEGLEGLDVDVHKLRVFHPGMSSRGDSSVASVSL